MELKIWHTRIYHLVFKSSTFLSYKEIWNKSQKKGSALVKSAFCGNKKIINFLG